MQDNYALLVKANLDRLFSNLPPDLASNLPATRQDSRFTLRAFGETCTISPDGIRFDSGEAPSILGILISLYALNASAEICIEQPFRSFKEFPGSMPYVGAFTTHTELVLAPHATALKQNLDKIKQLLNGSDAPIATGGDFSFLVYPLPKIALCYIVYEADDDFPASVTCLYSNNAHRFLPMDGLADVGEYTSRTILSLMAG